MRKIACHALSQLLLLQMIMLKLESVFYGLQTAGLCYAQPLNKGIFTACEYSFEMNPFCHASTKIVT